MKDLFINLVTMDFIVNFFQTIVEFKELKSIIYIYVH